MTDILATPVWELLALALGLIVGSFANVCIHRLPLGQSVVTPASRCPKCGAPIRPLENIPVISYLVLLGRCRSCRAAISPRYPAVETANGLAYLALAILRGPSLQALVAMVLVSGLLVLSLIDLEHHILPNVITRPGIAMGLAASFLPGPPSPLESLGAAVAGYLALAAVAVGARWYYGEEALGQGDWKMVAMLGAFLGWRGMFVSVLLGTLSGAVVGVGLMAFCGRSRRTRIPLGTFLGLGGVAAVFAGEPILAWYWGFVGG